MPKSGEIKIVADDFRMPNGLAFSPDEETLYIADSGRSHDPDFPMHIRAFKVGADGGLSDGEVFCETGNGLPDGFRLDTDGNLWTSAGPSVEVYAPSGDLLGRINFPQSVANLVFGGPKRNRLFVCCDLRALFGLRFGDRRPAALSNPRKSGFHLSVRDCVRKTRRSGKSNDDPLCGSGLWRRRRRLAHHQRDVEYPAAGGPVIVEDRLDRLAADLGDRLNDGGQRRAR